MTLMSRVVVLTVFVAGLSSAPQASARESPLVAAADNYAAAVRVKSDVELRNVYSTLRKCEGESVHTAVAAFSLGEFKGQVAAYALYAAFVRRAKLVASSNVELRPFSVDVSRLATQYIKLQSIRISPCHIVKLWRGRGYQSGFITAWLKDRFRSVGVDLSIVRANNAAVLRDVAAARALSPGARNRLAANAALLWLAGV